MKHRYRDKYGTISCVRCGYVSSYAPPECDARFYGTYAPMFLEQELDEIEDEAKGILVFGQDPFLSVTRDLLSKRAKVKQIKAQLRIESCECKTTHSACDCVLKRLKGLELENCKLLDKLQTYMVIHDITLKK